MSLTASLSLLAFASGLGHLAAEHREWRAGVYVFKPLTTATLLLVAAVQPEADPSYRAAILVGLGFSLLGDVALMLPRDRFLAGLVAFFLGHLAYLAAFGLHLDVLAALPYGLALGFLLWLLWPHLGPLRVPVIAYGAVLALMAWQALARWTVLGTPEALAAMLGAALFVLSDAALAIERFVGPFRGARYVILGTYYPAQWLIALSV